MPFLIENKTDDGAGSGASLTVPVQLYVYGVFDGASVYIEIAGDEGQYVPVQEVQKNQDRFSSPGSVIISPEGAYALKARVDGAGDDTYLTVEYVEQA
jgi:hypothetical protein